MKPVGQGNRAQGRAPCGVVTLLMLGFASLGLAGLSHSSVGRSLRQAARERESRDHAESLRTMLSAT